jgi:translation elongation factor EF-1alpha
MLKLATSLPFIPIAAMHGDNLIEHSGNMPWYTAAGPGDKDQMGNAPTLIDALGYVTGTI